MPKFLILRFSSIGDIVLTTPVMRCLKLQLPNAEVHFATKKSYKTIVESNPYIDKLHLLEASDNELIACLKAEKFDFIIDLHHNIRTLKIKFLLGVKSFSFDKLNWQKWLLVNLKVNKMPTLHIVDRYLKTIESFGVKNDTAGLDYFIPEKDFFPISIKEKFAVYAIGGQYFTKKLPLTKMVELVKTIKIPIFLVGGPEDFDQAELLKKELSADFWPGIVINTCGKCNLNQSASIIAQSDIVYTHDTGMMHVAAALKKKVISIWGNTIPEFGMYPYATDYEVVENKNLSCRPCSKIGFDHCPKGHFKCMTELVF